MDTETNPRKNRRKRAVGPSSTDSTRTRRRGRKHQRDFWESIVDPQSSDRQKTSQTNQPGEEQPDSSSSESPANSAPDVCPVSQSIEAVFVSKSEAHKKRAQQREQNAGYEKETRRPIVSLIFVLPLLVFYEVGSILLGHQSLRSGIDQWFHQPLYLLGFGGLVVLPLVTIAALVTCHHHQQDHWRIRPGIIVGMIAEAIGLGLILYWAANAINELVAGTSATAASATLALDAWWANIVACVGSGIYEELIFRIGLLTLLILCARKLIADQKMAAVAGVLGVSLLFTALHYNGINPAGNPFELSSFAFRFFASIVFSILFLFRGFGIAVGAHVAYDVLTQV